VRHVIISNVPGGSYTVYVSYPSKTGSAKWLHAHFLDELCTWLNEQYSKLAIKVYCPDNQERNDAAVPLGGAETSDIAAELARSRMMVPVWSPSYFREEYRLCVWEMEFFQRRRLGDIMPVLYAKREQLPEAYRELPMEDFSNGLNLDFPGWKQTAKYGEFVEKVRRFADRLATRITNAPPPSQPLPDVALVAGLPKIDQLRLSAA
jgi:hypothetical protein